jgi:hypothetical protein
VFRRFLIFMLRLDQIILGFNGKQKSESRVLVQFIASVMYIATSIAMVIAWNNLFG